MQQILDSERDQVAGGVTGNDGGCTPMPWDPPSLPGQLEDLIKQL